jgi:hypothetical protein
MRDDLDGSGGGLIEVLYPRLPEVAEEIHENFHAG